MDEMGLSAKTAHLCSLPLDEDHVVLIRVSKVSTRVLVSKGFDAKLISLLCFFIIFFSTVHC